jgi:hypothetical protein
MKSVSPSTTTPCFAGQCRVPSNLECRACNGTELGGDGEDAIKLPVGIGRNDLCRYLCHDSRLSYPHICHAIVVSESQLDRAILVEFSAIEARIFAESREQKLSLVVRRFGFAWHFAGLSSHRIVVRDVE